ncbi:MAG: hypothetical protein V1736_08585 [Pseudomonadota bacterium]
MKRREPAGRPEFHLPARPLAVLVLFVHAPQAPCRFLVMTYIRSPRHVINIDFQIKFLGALSVGDVRTGTIPSLLPSQKHYLKVYRRVPLVTCDHHEFDPIQAKNELDFFWIR